MEQDNLSRKLWSELEITPLYWYNQDGTINAIRHTALIGRADGLGDGIFIRMRVDAKVLRARIEQWDERAKHKIKNLTPVITLNTKYSLVEFMETVFKNTGLNLTRHLKRGQNKWSDLTRGQFILIIQDLADNFKLYNGIYLDSVGLTDHIKLQQKYH